jgi:hypothetical protein
MALFGRCPEVEPLSPTRRSQRVSGAVRQLRPPAAIGELIRAGPGQQQILLGRGGHHQVRGQAGLGLGADGMASRCAARVPAAAVCAADVGDRGTARLRLRTVGDIAQVPRAALGALGRR